MISAIYSAHRSRAHKSIDNILRTCSLTALIFADAIAGQIFVIMSFLCFSASYRRRECHIKAMRCRPGKCRAPDEARCGLPLSAGCDGRDGTTTCRSSIGVNAHRCRASFALHAGNQADFQIEPMRWRQASRDFCRRIMLQNARGGVLLCVV